MTAKNKNFSKQHPALAAILLMALLFIASTSFAQQDIMPATTNISNYEATREGATHPIVRLTPEKSEIIRLEKEAKSIIVGNPAHLNVLMDTTKTLILVPHTPGATHFTVLGKDGDVIMQRHVIVASPKEKYIRIRRSCAAAGADSCAPTSVYYCPDMCHNVEIMDGSGGGDGSEAGTLSGAANTDTETTAEE